MHVAQPAATMVAKSFGFSGFHGKTASNRERKYRCVRASAVTGKHWLSLGLRAAVLAAAMAPCSARAITVQFDYRYDTRSFFTDTASGAPIAERRELLELAASAYANFSDNLTAISPQSGDTWSVTITHPSLGGPPLRLTDLSIAADTIRVYVGGSPSAPGVLGFAGAGSNLTASGSESFVSNVFTRGQANAIGDDATDYGVWGGYIWFNAAQDWYFGADPGGLSAGSPDFLTTATHELGHILGFGGAESWFNQIDTSTNTFSGKTSSAVYGGPVPLDNFDSHWAEGLYSEVSGISQETLMDPSTVRGQRELMTSLDYAGFRDIGWQVAAVPLPGAVWLFGSALLGWLKLRRRPAC